MVLVPFYSETRLAYERPLAGRQMFRDHQQQFMQRGRKRKPIETGLPGADSQTGLQRVAASASEKKKKWWAFICWVWKVSSMALLYVDISFLLQGFVFCPVVMQIQNPKPGAASQPPLPREKGNPITQRCSFPLCSFQVHPCKGIALS